MLVWQKSMKLLVEIYRLVQLLPKTEMYGLADQMRRAVVSIPANIAEGKGRDSDREFIRFLSISRGSCSELETHLEACLLVGYLNESDVKDAFSLLDEVGKMLSSLMKKLKNLASKV